MVASWIKRDFGDLGVTQCRPGPQLAAVQRHFGGRALLCIDVSWSMEGARLKAAIEGGLDFLREAREAHYCCGLILWAGTVERYLPTTAPRTKVETALRRAKLGKYTRLTPALKSATHELGRLNGDRVICVFGDGGITDTAEATRAAEKARKLGIRFVVRGLGDQASASLGRVLTPDIKESGQTVDSVADMRRSIASMAAEVLATRRSS